MLLKLSGKFLLFTALTFVGVQSFAQQFDDIPIYHADVQRGEGEPLPYMQYKHDSGYMHRNLISSLRDMLIVNPNVSSLFHNHRNMQAQTNVALPRVFQPLINFSYRFMKANSRRDSEAANGVKHDHLAFQFVRASFCFGNDPFMVLAKIKRESAFNRTLISSGAAVGFTQMTGPGIKEVQHQMSGNADLAMPGVKEYFRKAIACFTGNANYHNFSGKTDDLKKLIRADWKLDVIYGQILLKVYTAYTVAATNKSRSLQDLNAAYAGSFIMYNGDITEVDGRCTGARVPMKQEYSCDIMQNFEQLSNQWKFEVRNYRVNMT